MQNADPADNGIGYFLSLGSVGFAGCAEAILFSLFLAARITELRERYLREQEQRLRAEQENENERLRTLDALLTAQKAELAALRYQINPHFLFNTLGSLRALAGEDAKRTQTMIGKLSEYLRYTLYPEQGTDLAQIHHQEDVGMVSLREEIAMIQNYFDIEHIRFEDALQVEYDLAPEALSFSIPGFLLQPLAENALKFGMQTSAKPLRITIAAYSERKPGAQTTLHIRITNSGTLVPAPQSTTTEKQPRSNGIGLNNVRERLRRTFGEKATLELHEENGKVTASILIVQD
jgi:sensor histidine kinase YesM